jgi:hypothetical protein
MKRLIALLAVGLVICGLGCGGKQELKDLLKEIRDESAAPCTKCCPKEGCKP